MFDNFQNLDPNYVPNNIKKEELIDREEYKDVPYDIIDNREHFYHRYKNEENGKAFSYGQEINFDFEVDDVVYVEENAIVSYTQGEEPTTETVGEYGQYFYNIPDEKLWKCTSRGQTVYQWQQIKPFSVPTKGYQKVYLSPIDGEVECDIFNRDGEIVYREILADGVRTIIITAENARTLIPDIYEFMFFFNGEFRASYNVIIKDTRNSFNKDINEIDKE